MGEETLQGGQGPREDIREVGVQQFPKHPPEQGLEPSGDKLAQHGDLLVL